MEALQIAQMLADLNDLQAAQDQTAARALVGANKTLDHKSPASASSLSAQAHAKSSAPSASSEGSRAGRFDKFGRRIFTPPLSRSNSGTPSQVGTPRGGEDADIDKASTLLSLYEIRAKLKEQDNSSLQKAREKINALAAKQHTGMDLMKPPTSNPREAPSARISFPK